jgi:hypothetical protein
MKRLPLFLICLLSICACNREKSVPGKAETPQAIILSTTIAPNSALHMSISFDPSPPRMSSKTKFHVELKDLSGAPVESAGVQVSLVMPLMDMGKNEFTLQPAGKAAYEGAGQFTMSGEWEVIVSAAAVGKSGKTTFNVRVED